jgi:hypothetical protein
MMDSSPRTMDCTYDVTAHWISSYFLGDKMHLPSRTGAHGGDGKERSLDKEAIPRHTVEGQRELQQRDHILVVRIDAFLFLSAPRQNSYIKAVDELLNDMKTHLADILLETLHAVRPRDHPQLEGAEPPSKVQVPVVVVDHRI